MSCRCRKNWPINIGDQRWRHGAGMSSFLNLTLLNHNRLFMYSSWRTNLNLSNLEYIYLWYCIIVIGRKFVLMSVRSARSRWRKCKITLFCIVFISKETPHSFLRPLKVKIAGQVCTHNRHPCQSVGKKDGGIPFELSRGMTNSPSVCLSLNIVGGGLQFFLLLHLEDIIG